MKRRILGILTAMVLCLIMLPVTALTALVYLALSLPLLFKFGLEKGRIFFLLLTAAFVVFGGVLLGWLGLSA